MKLGYGEVTGQRSSVVYNFAPATGHMDAIKYDDDQGNGHNHALDQVCSGNCHEAAHNGITYDNNCTNDHCNVIIGTEKAGE